MAYIPSGQLTKKCVVISPLSFFNKKRSCKSKKDEIMIFSNDFIVTTGYLGEIRLFIRNNMSNFNNLNNRTEYKA